MIKDEGAGMELHKLLPGTRLRTIDGATAEVVVSSEDGMWIKVRYVSTPGFSDLAGTEDLCHKDEVVDLEMREPS